MVVWLLLFILINMYNPFSKCIFFINNLLNKLKTVQGKTTPAEVKKKLELQIFLEDEKPRQFIFRRFFCLFIFNEDKILKSNTAILKFIHEAL